MANRGRIAAAYDAVAADYDRTLARDAWMRRILWRHFDAVFGDGDRILDVGCGTGIDTIHLASRGVRVTAVDVSAGMIAELHHKLAQTPWSALVDARVGDVIEVAREVSGPFDGMISSFAALNTVDLGAFAREASRLLRPRARIVCHMLSPGHWSRAARLWSAPPPERGRSDIHGEAIVPVGGEQLRHVSLGPDEIYSRHFEAHFVRRRVHALGLVVRRRMEPWMPERLLDLLGRIDVLVGGLPSLVSAGRFFVLDLEKRDGVAPILT